MLFTLLSRFSLHRTENINLSLSFLKLSTILRASFNSLCKCKFDAFKETIIFSLPAVSVSSCWLEKFCCLNAEVRFRRIFRWINLLGLFFCEFHPRSSTAPFCQKLVLKYSCVELFLKKVCVYVSIFVGRVDHFTIMSVGLGMLAVVAHDDFLHFSVGKALYKVAVGSIA